MRAGAPPSRGLVRLVATPGTEEQTQAVLGTEGCSALPCPHPASPPPLGLKCCWEGEGRWDRQLELQETLAAYRSPHSSSSLFLEAQPESVPPRSLHGTSEEGKPLPTTRYLESSPNRWRLAPSAF